MTHDQFGPWRKSSRSATDANCLEWAWATNRDRAGVRDSKQAGAGPVLTFDTAASAALVAMVRGRPGA